MGKFVSVNFCIPYMDRNSSAIILLIREHAAIAANTY